MENKLPPIMVQSQYIKDLSMEIPHAPVIFKKMQGQNPQVNVEINVEEATEDIAKLNNVSDM
ncbi:MAG: protein-export chaperone SecB, partial [Alphaproteobacteria bacterium]|nr:protein-export chaperone SecB [Alphaproteobacteria bacterium]